MLHLRAMRQRLPVSEEPNKTVLYRNAALDFHTGVFPTPMDALKAHKIDPSQRKGVYYHIKQLREESLPTPFKAVDIAVKVINQMILLSSTPTYRGPSHPGEFLENGSGTGGSSSCHGT